MAPRVFRAACGTTGVPGCLWHHGCSGRRRPRPPARLGVLTSFGAAPRSPPVPSGPSGALHTSDAWSLFGASSRSPARPHHRPRAPQPGPSSSSGALHTSGAWSLIGASSRSPARPRAPAAEPTPNFACNSVVTLKPTAPLLTTFGRFERVSRSQRRCRFHSAAHTPSQRCHRFHSDSLRCPRTQQNSPSTARIHPRTRQNSPSTLKTAKNERFLASRANFFTEVPLKEQRWANFVSAQAGTDLLGP